MMPTSFPSSSTGAFFKWFSPKMRHTSGRSACTSTAMRPFAPMSAARMLMSLCSFCAKSELSAYASTVCTIITTGSMIICPRRDR